MRNKILLFLILLLFNINLKAQITFQDHIIIDDTFSTKGAYSIFSTDIDNDGDMDVLSASKSDNKISWYENIDSQGTFGEQQIITTNALKAEAVFATDIDGDGDMDVLSASFDDNKIAWYKNIDGQGTFGSQQIITTNAFCANSVFGSDIDGDGDMDVISSSYCGNEIVWFENIDGLGSFSTKQIISSISNPLLIHLADIEGDGDMDVISISEHSEYFWLENIDGLGTFSSKKFIDSASRGPLSTSDIDGDGDLDLISVSNGLGLSWFENVDGQGTFGSPQVILQSIEAFESIFCDDINGDGYIDIVVSIFSDTRSDIVWFENTNGKGTFGLEQLISSYAKPTDLFVIDINNDGNLDVLSCSFSNNEIIWFKNTNGQGDFDEERLISQNAVEPKSIHSSDIDGDGDLDIVSCSYVDDKVFWFENIDGQGNFGKQKIISSYTERVGSVYSTDIDGDGDMDVISSSSVNSKVSWYENIDGYGRFGPQKIISIDIDGATWGENVVFSIDIDGDGDMDVLSGFDRDLFNNNIWFENIDGKGNFVSKKFTDHRFRVTDITGADIDHDNDNDIVIKSGGDIFWFENVDGNGGFNGEFNTIFRNNSEDGKSSIYIEDIDNDDDYDLLSVSSVDNTVFWFENIDGKGNFGSQKIISNSAIGAQSVFAIDIDNDKDIDIVSASLFDNTIAWYENLDSHGVFGTKQIISTNANGAFEVIAIDINSDGKNDLVSTSLYDNKIQWYENTSSLSISKDIISKIYLYPNPTNEIVYIDSPLKTHIIELYNSSGKLVLTKVNNNEINLSSLSNGLYYYKLIGLNGLFETGKIIKK